jgi:hypothetical protein
MSQKPPLSSQKQVVCYFFHRFSADAWSISTRTTSARFTPQ